MKFLVVGGAGYVGSHMVKHLFERGHEVTVLDNYSRGHRDALQAARPLEADLLDSPAVERAFDGAAYDAVMHFAAYAYVGESVSKPAEYYRNNVAGTLNLLAAMNRAGVKRLVFSSTCATYGNPVQVPMGESHPQEPINPYGASKLMVERVLRDYAAAYGLSSVALRYFNAAGSDPNGRIGERHEPETHLVPLALLEARRVLDGGDPERTALQVFGDDYETPDGTCIRDYVHVDDLASAHLAAAERMVGSTFTGFNAYNLGIGKGFSVLEVIESCRRVTGAEIQYRKAPRRAGDPPRLVADSRAAQRDLGWQPRYTELDPIVATAWRWFSRQR